VIAGCNLIGDGSELLEATPYAPLIGPTILPVLGAVPDAAIVFFSGFGNDAQEQLDTGMGALAGSTVMLLTIPWVLNIVGGAVDLIEKDGELSGDYPSAESDPEGCGRGNLRDPKGWNIFTTGIEVDTEPIQASGWWMLVTCIPYVVIQIAAFKYVYYDDASYADAEKPYAWVGFAFCCIFFIAYLVYQLWITSGDSREDKTAAKAEALMQQGVPITAVLSHHVDGTTGGDEEAPVASSELPEYGSSGDEKPSTALVGVNKVILKTIKPTFDKYCTVPEDGGEKYLDADELNIVFGKEFGINKRADQLKLMFAEFDTDGNGEISLQEFCVGVEKFLKGTLEKDDDAEDEEEEEEPMTAAIKALSAGTLMVLLFSDPLVDVIDELGDLTGISDFYLAFLLAPMVTNGSELIASYRFAQKKTKNSITNSLQQLYGAAIMNNTMTLGVFLLLIAVQGLYWDYSAESIAIVFVQVVLFGLCFTKVMTVASGFAVLMLYPICLVGVYILESGLGMS